MHAIEIVLDQSNNSLENLPEEPKVFEHDYVSEVKQVEKNTPKLFSVVNNSTITHYYFYMQHFGYTTGDSLTFTNVFTSESKVKLEFAPVATAADMYSLIFNYGSIPLPPQRVHGTERVIRTGVAVSCPS